MLNKYFPVLLVRIRIRKPFFRLTLPVLLYVFIGLIDCALDILEAGQSVFSRKLKEGELPVFSGALTVVSSVRSILAGIGSTEKFDLVNVETDGVSIHIEVW